MLEEVLGTLHNWFEAKSLSREFAVTNGTLELPEGFLLDGQFFRVCGSVLNDGLHQWPDTGMRDEHFMGVVFALAVPQEVVDLSERIAKWREDNRPGQYQSESFGGYSYTRATVDGAPLTWQGAFRSELNRWRRLP